MTREEAKVIVDEKTQLVMLSPQDKQLLLQAMQVLANHWSIPEEE